MKILLDTNIILDALQERTPFDTQAKEIMRRAQDGTVSAMFTANTVTDIYYLYSKARDAKAARSAIEFLLGQYEVVGVTHEDCVNALKIGFDDFEDALLCVCAKKAHADYIVSRDEAFLRSELPVKVISPQEFLTKFE